MATIAWIGLGHMGHPMTKNLVDAGHTVRGYDIVEESVRSAAEHGVIPTDSIASAVEGAEIVFTMLPKGEHSRAVYEQPGGVFDSTPTEVLLVDSSTIDFDTAHELHDVARSRGFDFIDAPVSGGTAGAEAGTLTFMVGGTDADVARARPFIEPMAGHIFHAGGAAAGQAAKIVNNMMLMVSMQGMVEGAVLSRKLGLDPQTFFDIASVSSGDSWPLRTWYANPGVVPKAASNNDFDATFAAALAFKDIGLAMEAAKSAGLELPGATVAYEQLKRIVDEGDADKDCTIIVRNIDPEAPGLPG